MKSIKRFAKKSLSLILCLAMVMTTVIFFDIGITKPEAAVTPTATTDMEDVLFYVPEAVYLRPHAQSWITNTTSTFHFFIENDVVDGNNLKSAPTVNQAIPTIGNVRFQYSDKDGKDLATNVQLSYRWLNSSLSSTLNGNGIRLGSADVGVNQNVTLSKASEANYYQTTITAENSKSPDLASGETGCYIEWTVKYHDNTDNLDKAITAYTYVYKPNVVPVSTSGRILNNTGTDSFCQQISWLTGFHSVVSSNTTNYKKYAKYSTAAHNTGAMMPFQTSAPLGAINENTAGAVGTAFSKPSAAVLDSGAMMNSYFASTNTSYAYFKAGQANATFNNYGVGAYFADSANVSTTLSDTTTYSTALHAHDTTDNGGGTSTNDHSVYLGIDNNAVAGIVIDTSRYFNLNQVPNLGIGLMLTDSEEASGGAWYVADYTGKSQSSTILSAESRDSYFGTDGWNVWADRGDMIAHEAEATSGGNFASAAKDCGLKYAGTWPKALGTVSTNGGTYDYAFKTGAATDDEGDGASVTTIMHMRATQYNKANLRTAVANAQKDFALLGIYDLNYNSHYYDNTGAYTTFINAYKTACHALTAVNTVITNPDTLATNLNNALAALKAEEDVFKTVSDDDNNVTYDENGNVVKSTDSCRKTGIAYQYNVGVIRNEDGTYRIVKIPGAKQCEVGFNLRDKVNFTAESYTGYNYIGMYKMVSHFSIDALADEAYNVVSIPTLTDTNNRANVNVSQDSSALTTTLTASSTVSTSTQVATFSGSTVEYPYAYDTDITYLYIYELVDAEVLFGNEFDFDAFRWTGASNATMSADHVANTVTLNTTSTNTDAYTNGYNNSQRGYMTLVPGRVYEFSCDYENLSSSAANVSMFLFTLAATPTATSSTAIGTSGTDFKSVGATASANGSGKLTGTITVPAGRPYATIRVGSSSASVSVKFSNIVVRDITTFTDTLLTNTITMPDPIYKSGAANAEVTDFPTITRPGYQLAGWSTVREANGNGAAASIVTTTTVPGAGNRTLYPVWQTNVIYNTDGGAYRKSSDSMQTSYQVEGRWNVAIGTSVPVSNRVVQGQTGWDSADVNYTYVPYKPGYNFKGWKAVSVDPAVNGNVYWPMDAVVTNANVEFTAQWEAAPEIALNTTSRITSSNNDGERAFYPGQVHFYKYVPATNQYASAYTYNSEGDLEMQAFDGSLNFISENDNYEYSYGIQDIVETDPMITMSLTAGETYYAGIGMHSITGTTAGGTNFRIQEHTVKFTLLPNGGSINGSQETQYVTGYSNIDTVLPSTGELYGYDFAGWKSNEVPAKEYAAGVNIPGADNYNRLDGYTTSLVRDVILTAQWTPKPFSIIYDQNIPTGATPTEAAPMPGTGTLRYATDGTISEIVPSMAGYTFKGWATTAEKVEGEKLYQKGETVPASTSSQFFADNNGGSVTLYARWAPNLIIVRFKPGAGTGEEFTQNFYYDQEQAISTQNFDPEKYSVGFYEVGTTEAIETLKADLEFDGWQDVLTGTPNYTYANGATIKNPNGFTGTSDTVGTETILYAKWKGGASTVTTPVWVSTGDTHVLAGWSTNSDASTIDYAVGEAFAPKGDMKLYAVWYPVDTAESVIQNFGQYDINASVVTGVNFTNSDLTEYTEIESMSEYPVYDTVAYKGAVQRYEAAREALKQNATAENNREYYEAIKAVEAMPAPETKAPITAYLTQFTISYADGVTGKVAAGEYKLADMNLNHYTTDDLNEVLQAYTDADAVENMLNQSVINRSVVTYATKYANKQDLNTTPVYNMYDTAAAIKDSELIESDDITAMNYVYTGKGNYTYYCYTSSKTPTILLTVDDDKVDNRYCYPTTFDSGATLVSSTKGATAEMPEYGSTSDSLAKSKYDKYLAKGIGSNAEGKALDTSYYYQKAMVELKPDFSTASDKATVTYTFSARDDAFAGLNGEDINYADSARLASDAEKGNLNDIPQGEDAANRDKDGNITEIVTPENTITIIVDYHVGEGFDVTGKQAAGDEWLKQYHLSRSSGGASNWELPKSGDSVYTVDDSTYGQTDYGSFTYTFVVGEANDFANCVLTSADVNDVIATVKENYADMKAVAFDGAQEIVQFKLNQSTGKMEYMTTHAAGTGLGFKSWSNTNWSFNYYPLSNAYTYVHLVDRWGNTVDKVIQVPNLDGSAVQLYTNTTGKADVIELGGSGIDTMSFSAQSFEIVPDTDSVLTDEGYVSTGNTITLYTGEANKKYTLEANDVATNKTTSDVTTDAEGYLTLTVEDKAFDTESGAYTFTLNGTKITLYGEIEKNVISATGDTVEAGSTAMIEVVTTEKVTMVQLVSSTGSTTTATEYTENEDGNRVWIIEKTKNVGEYEYTVRAKVNGSWIAEGETVTVTVTEPMIFLGAVTEVSYTPSTSTRNEFMITVTGRPEKVQIISEDGGTRTYDRYHAKVVIISYDEEGNVVDSISRELSYEVWTIEMNLPAEEEFTAVARYGRQWSKNSPYVFAVALATKEFDDEVYSMELESEEGWQGKVKATVVTGLDVTGVRFIMDNSSTATYYTSTEADGKLTYVGTTWMNHSGENIIIVKIRVNNAWIPAGELNYYAF